MGRPFWSWPAEALIAAWMSCAAASISRLSSNCSVIEALPKLLVEVIAVSAAIWPKACSSGVVTDEARVVEIGRQISPINHVSADDPPTLIIHGDADKLVPIQQAELIVDKLRQAGVEAKLVVKPGAAHGWPGLDKDVSTLADWFDQHLRKTPTTP